MSTRVQRGRLRVVSAPQSTQEGRRACVASVQASRVGGLAGAVAAVAVALAEVARARAEERAAPSPESTGARRKAERRARHARHMLRVRSSTRDEQAITAALSADGGLFVRAALAAGDGTREHALRAVIDMALVAREHAVEGTAALVTLARSLRWAALSASLLDRALTAQDPDVVRLAALAGREARLDLLGALAMQGRTPEQDRGTDLAALLAGAASTGPVMAANHENDADTTSEDNER